MQKFNKNKYLKKVEFQKKWNSYSKYVYIVIPCILCLIIGIYFAYSKFFVNQEASVMKTTVDNFIYGDIIIGSYIDGKYSNNIPTKDDGYVVEKVTCDNGATGQWDEDTWGLLTTNLTTRTKCNVYFKKYYNGNYIEDLAKNDTANLSNDDSNNVRYIGKNPNNYIYFNCSDYTNQSDSTCEKWRIIGLFSDVTKSDGTKDKLLKIIRNDVLGNFKWDYKQTGVGTSTSTYGSNDWSDSQLMMMLNPIDYLKSGYTNSNDIISLNNQQLYSKMGSYYNATKGCLPNGVTSGDSFSCTDIDFSNTGLKNDTTRNAIESVVWNLGGSSTYSNVTPSLFYQRERGDTVYTNHITTWTGKIGLMYPSDYGYATSGGSTTTRKTCLETALFNWDGTDYSDCKDNDYLYSANDYQWTLTPHAKGAPYIYIVFATGRSSYFATYNDYAVRPSLYLKSNIKIDYQSGDGSSSNPYKLKF